MAVRLYGLFEKQADGTWKRLLPSQAYTKQQAVRVFQGYLLQPYLEGGAPRELQPIGHVK